MWLIHEIFHLNHIKIEGLKLQKYLSPFSWSSPVGSWWAACTALHQRTAHGDSSHSALDHQPHWSVRQKKKLYSFYSLSTVGKTGQQTDLNSDIKHPILSLTSSSFCMYSGSFRSKPEFSSSLEVGSMNLCRNLCKQDSNEYSRKTLLSHVALKMEENLERLQHWSFSHLELLLADTDVDVSSPDHQPLACVCLTGRSSVSSRLQTNMHISELLVWCCLFFQIFCINVLTGSDWRSTWGALRTDPRSGRCRAGVPRTPLRGVPSILELGVPYIRGELMSTSFGWTVWRQGSLSQILIRWTFKIKTCRFKDILFIFPTWSSWAGEERRVLRCWGTEHVSGRGSGHWH